MNQEHTLLIHLFSLKDCVHYILRNSFWKSKREYCEARKNVSKLSPQSGTSREELELHP